MKWSDFFKKLGIDLESEVDDASTDTSKEIDGVNKNENTDSSNINDDVNKEQETKEVTDSNKEEDKPMAFKAPKIDKNGFIDLTEVEDADIKAFFKTLNDNRKTELDARKAEDDKRAVNDAITKYASNVKFAEGWSLEDALKLGDFSKVANDENISKEIENAFTNLKAAKAGMFVADKKSTKSTPVSEGFSPTDAEKNAAMSEDDLIAMAYGADE